MVAQTIKGLFLMNVLSVFSFSKWKLALFFALILGAGVCASESLDFKEPMVGSWTFSGLATNESGESYGYFFQMQRRGSDYHTKTALIDGQTNKLLLFYEGNEKIDNITSLDWHVGRSFIRHNPITDSWIFGVNTQDQKGFNFKVDMGKTENKGNEALELKPGVELQAIETTRLNGHIQTGIDNKEQFVTGNKAWFTKLWFSKAQKVERDINTTLCSLGNEHGFYAANLKESNSIAATVAGWRNASGAKVRMSQFISIKNLANNECLLNLGVPKLRMKLLNTLSHEDISNTVAGFSKNPMGFCVVEKQSFLPMG